MGRLATTARGIAMSLLVGILIIVALFYIAVNYSEVTKEFTCDGFTTNIGAFAESDHGRLQVSHYRFWVGLWSSSDGNAIFQTTKFAFYEGEMHESGEGNFTVYLGISPQQIFAFSRATNELSVESGPMKFKGNCIAAM